MAPPLRRRPRDKTPRSCPLCAESAAPVPTTCQLCGGTKLVDDKTWEAWALRPPAKSTSTTISFRGIAGGRLVELYAVGGADARALTKEGEQLIAIMDSWLEVPADGPERGEHYRAVNAWLAKSTNLLRAKRASGGKP